MRNFLIVFIALSIMSCVNQEELFMYSSLDEGLKMALLEEKEVLLIFDFLANPTNSAQELIHDGEVRSIIEDYVVVLLNVDEPNGKGELNRAIQDRYGSSTQPTYYILDQSGVVLKGPLGYCKKEKFLSFIEE